MLPKKSLGQHFLKDPNVSGKIVNLLEAEPDDSVLEIGPGTGALTEWLIKKYTHLTVIEVDRRACEKLSSDYPGLDIIHADIRKFDWSSLTDRSPLFVIGNLPYYITSPILISLLEQRRLINEAVLMVQKEVASRLTAVPFTKEYGILSVQLQLFATVELCFEVHRHVFYPPPKVDSAVVRIRFNKKDPDCEIPLLRHVIRTAFNQRRKKLKNALKPLLLKDVELPPKFDFTRRAEELEPDEYVELTNLLVGAGILTNR